MHVGRRRPLRVEPLERELGERHRLGAAAGGRLEAGQTACEVRGLVASGVLLHERDAHAGDSVRQKGRAGVRYPVSGTRYQADDVYDALSGGASVTRFIRASMVAFSFAAVAGLAEPRAQGGPTPYKLGMFQQGDRIFVGMVLKDEVVIDLSRTIAGTPSTMKALIEQWGPPTAIGFASVASDATSNPPASAHEGVAAETPAADHRPEGAAQHGGELPGARDGDAEHQHDGRASAAAVDPKIARGIPGYWERRPGDPRQNPYFFVKANTAITVHDGPIVLPKGRTQIDWECEMNIVIGKVAKHVSRDNAAEYIFGYTLMNDVSDRGGRADGRHGSDWQLGKSHDTFAPLGPYIVPREFVAEPAEAGGEVHAERHRDAGLEHRPHDPHRVRAGRIRIEHDDAAPRRPDLHRQPCRRRHRAGHAGLLQARRSLDLHDRVDRHASKRGRG